MEWDEAAHFRGPAAQVCRDWHHGSADPEEYGGAGNGLRRLRDIMEELARVDASIALAIAAHNSLGAGHIFHR